MGHCWLMLCVIADRILRKIPSSAVIKTAILQFHLSCLGIDAIPKTWYCPKCRALPEFKRGGSKQKSTSIITEALKMNSICTCKTVANKNDKLVKCTNVDCPNGTFFHLPCLGERECQITIKFGFVQLV